MLNDLYGIVFSGTSCLVVGTLRGIIGLNTKKEMGIFIHGNAPVITRFGQVKNGVLQKREGWVEVKFYPHQRVWVGGRGGGGGGGGQAEKVLAMLKGDSNVFHPLKGGARKVLACPCGAGPQLV